MKKELKSIGDIDFTSFNGRSYHPSPGHWEDQVLYFLLLDRFSDGNEDQYRDNGGKLVKGGKTPPMSPEAHGNAVQTPSNAAAWRAAGENWVGGHLKGLSSKIGYLARLGVTCLWVSPVFKQMASKNTYHGYGIQDFLDVDPHFGTREDLQEMVRIAHAHGLYVVLDIIFNHAGDIFEYKPQPCGGQETTVDPPWTDAVYDVQGYRDATGRPVLPFCDSALADLPGVWPDGAVWPRELQTPAAWTRKGHISNWDYYPEKYEGDFFSLKNVTLNGGSKNRYQPSAALQTLCQVYQYWIGYADLDGYRVDTVKHMEREAVKYFVEQTQSFAHSLGKKNFYLIGEIVGGRQHAYDTRMATGLNAALGIDDIPARLEAFCKGYGRPADYFGIFHDVNEPDDSEPKWHLDNVVTMIDDHDQVWKSWKARFCAGVPENGGETSPRNDLILAALAVNATTLGIPCIYYGTEQAFDGEGGSDQYLRECMFGGEFGAFRSRRHHCFSEDHPVYRGLAGILVIRQAHETLRRGRQYLRQISGDGNTFGYPEPVSGNLESIVAWSGILDLEEMLCAINSSLDETRTAWVIVDAGLNPPGSVFQCIYSSSPRQTLPEISSCSMPGGIVAVKLTVPPAAFVVFKRK